MRSSILNTASYLAVIITLFACEGPKRQDRESTKNNAADIAAPTVADGDIDMADAGALDMIMPPCVCESETPCECEDAMTAGMTDESEGEAAGSNG